MNPHRLSLSPSGTTGNEALHNELRNWISNIMQMHQATLELKLSVLQTS